jgi:alkylation response protein AidB-like acyl-CoA dehydrogenase
MMLFPLTDDDLAFREEVRAFLAEHLPPEWRGVSEMSSRPDRALIAEWIRRLAAQGWLTTGWPRRYAGRALTVTQRYLLDVELANARAPLLPNMELKMVAPLIARFGSEAQQDYYLPRILSGEDIWAQGFSEPEAGSDLASLRTTATRVDDGYVIDGRKIWTTNAHIATQFFCLARTDRDAVKPQRGISMFLLPMTTPGISVRPIRTIDGRHHFNEVFLDQVHVPATALLGEENKGWNYAKALLENERLGIADVQPTRVLLNQVATVIAQAPDHDRAGFDRRLALLEIDLESLEFLEFRAFENARLGTERGYEPSLLKLLGARVRQELLILGREALGPLAEARSSPQAPRHAAGVGEHFVNDSLFYRAMSIYGGSSEIQRELIARTVLAQGKEF